MLFPILHWENPKDRVLVPVNNVASSGKCHFFFLVGSVE